MKKNKESKLEVRQLATECRAIEEDGKKSIEGYALLYDHESRLISTFWEGEFYETIERGALDKVLESKNLDVIYTPNHDFSKVIARTTSGTLELKSDDKGLKYIVRDIPNISYANDIYESIKRGDTFESSFSFMLNDNGQNWTKKEDGADLRTISEISYLKEVSSVTDGAYSNTDVAARSLQSNSDLLELDETHKHDLELKKKKLKLLNLKK